jgi:hypothetical protein
VISRRSIVPALASVPLGIKAARSQQAPNAHRVGLLRHGSTSPVVRGLTAGFAKRGYVVGTCLRAGIIYQIGLAGAV